jgi:3-oxoisoapionate kinase
MKRAALAFIGDDFTGSTDALESLALLGVRAALYTSLPTIDEVSDLDAFGIATTARAMSPVQMDEQLAPIVVGLRAIGVKRIHYKICSTFDSAPHVGSIGKAIDIGLAACGGSVPVVGGAPDLGRFCVFGNLYARFGSEPAPYRIDRHPSMRQHPITPMDEADLRLHLGKQTAQPIGLVPLHTLRSGKAQLPPGVTLVDALHQTDHAFVGRLIESARFIVGPSSVGTALVKCDALPRNGAEIPRATASGGPALVVSGSCAPVTQDQIAQAARDGFAVFVVRPDAITSLPELLAAIETGRSLVLHTDASRPIASEAIPGTLSRVVQGLLEDAPQIRRIILAGGDTSGELARSLGITRIRITGTLVRGAPLCTVRSNNPRLDRTEFVFKGGQIGGERFFAQCRDGTSKEND